MKGIIMHPLRIAALDRMKVLRVPFREQPPDDSWFVGIGRSRGNPVAIFQAGATQYPVRLPYAPGEYFVREITWEPTSMIIRDCYYDLDINQKQFEALRNLFYKKIPAGRMNPDFARHYLTLGPPVPCRLGDVTEEMAEREVLDYCRFGDGDYEEDPEQVGYPSHEASIEYANRAYRRAFARQWDYLYPQHSYSPERWTWGYPMEVRKRNAT